MGAFASRRAFLNRSCFDVCVGSLFAVVALLLPGCDSKPRSSSDVQPAPISHLEHLDAEWSRSASGGLVFVPSYSQIYHTDMSSQTELTSTLSVHNTDPTGRLTLLLIDYYDESGKLLRNYLLEPRTLTPLETHHVVVEQNDVTGGTGAKFLVAWKSDRQLQCPLVENVMVRTTSQQGLSLISQGVTIKEKAGASFCMKGR